MPTIALSEVKIWSDNYNEGDIGAIGISIRRFGCNRSVSLWKRNECRAGNHTVLALRQIKAEGPNPEFDMQWPPAHVEVDEAGEWHIQYVDIRHLDETKALAYAIADNRLARRASVDENILAKYLQSFEEADLLASGYDEDDVTRMVKFVEQDADLEPAAPWVDPTAAADIYAAAQLKQVVLMFPPEEFVDVVDRMARLRAQYDLESNSDLFIHMLEVCEREYSGEITAGN